MTLLETLNERRRLRTSSIRLTEELDIATAAIKEAFPGYQKTSVLSLEQIITQLEQSLQSWAWDDVTVGRVALALRAWLSADIDPADRVKSFLRSELTVSTNSALLSAACEAYVEGWDRSRIITSWLRDLLEQQIPILPANWRRTFASLPELLFEDGGPTALATRMAEQTDAYQWLIDQGIAYPHAGGFMAATHSRFLEAVSPVVTIDGIDAVFRWVFPSNMPAMENASLAGAVDTLLAPWARANSTVEVRSHLLKRLLEEFGDPRNSKPEFWSLVSPAGRKVMVRWIAGQSMDALLAVISEAKTKNHHWEPRHSFWKGLYNRGLIDEAWIALSKDAMDIANYKLAMSNDPIYSMVSRQVARGDKKETCLLIMRIGRFVVLEGSHDYRVHIFDQHDPRAPKFYEDEYDANAMRSAVDDPNARIHDIYGSWKNWVERRLF